MHKSLGKVVKQENKVSFGQVGANQLHHNLPQSVLSSLALPVSNDLEVVETVKAKLYEGQICTKHPYQGHSPTGTVPHQILLLFAFLCSSVWLSSGCHSIGKRSPFLRFMATLSFSLVFSLLFSDLLILPITAYSWFGPRWCPCRQPISDLGMIQAVLGGYRGLGLLVSK